MPKTIKLNRNDKTRIMKPQTKCYYHKYNITKYKPKDFQIRPSYQTDLTHTLRG